MAAGTDSAAPRAGRLSLPVQARVVEGLAIVAVACLVVLWLAAIAAIGPAVDGGIGLLRGVAPDGPVGAPPPPVGDTSPRAEAVTMVIPLGVAAALAIHLAANAFVRSAATGSEGGTRLHRVVLSALFVAVVLADLALVPLAVFAIT